MRWQVSIKERIVKAIRNRSKVPIEVESALMALVSDLEIYGPAVNWPNYGKLFQSSAIDRRHCHLQRGRPTWVACWEVDKKNKRIEVYYVGTHEKAPY